MAQNVLRYNVVIVGRFFNKGSWTSEARKKEHPEECKEEPDGAPKELPPPKKEEREFTWNPLVRAPCVCAAFGHATATRGSVDVRWKGKPEPTGKADQSTNIIESFGYQFNHHRVGQFLEKRDYSFKSPTFCPFLNRSSKKWFLLRQIVFEQ